MISRIYKKLLQRKPSESEARVEIAIILDRMANAVRDSSNPVVLCRYLSLCNRRLKQLIEIDHESVWKVMGASVAIQNAYERRYGTFYGMSQPYMIQSYGGEA